MALNAKQLQFCIEYRKDHNASQAAIRAGYSERSAGQIAGQLLKLPEVQSWLAKADEAMAAKIEVDTQWVVRQYLDIVERCMQAKNAVVKGIELPYAVFDPVNALAALDRLREYTGGFPGSDADPLVSGAHRRDLTSQAGRVLREMSNTELAKLESELRAKNAKKLPEGV